MSEQEIKVPDLGGADEVEVIEVLVSKGDSVETEDPILTVESDKASVELPSPGAGKITKITVKVGDKVKEGDVVGMMEASDDAGGGDEGETEEPEAAEDDQKASQDSSESGKEKTPEKASGERESKPDVGSTTYEPPAPGTKVHAGPAVRKLAREFGADLTRIKGSGPKHRILKDDV